MNPEAAVQSAGAVEPGGGDPIRRVWALPGVVQDLLASYGAAEDREPCGVLLGRSEQGAVRVVEAAEVPNAHPTPHRAFRILPQTILEIVRGGRARGLTVVGFWHGHLEGGAEPSPSDIEGLASAEALGPSSRTLVILGRGGGRAVLLRAYVRGAEGVMEIPLAT